MGRVTWRETSVYGVIWDYLLEIKINIHWFFYNT